MAIIGKLMGARPSMSAPRAAPRPTPVVSRPSLDFLTGGQPKQTIPAPSLDRDALIQDILSKIEVPSVPVFVLFCKSIQDQNIIATLYLIFISLFSIL